MYSSIFLLARLRSILCHKYDLINRLNLAFVSLTQRWVVGGGGGQQRAGGQGYYLLSTLSTIYTIYRLVELLFTLRTPVLGPGQHWPPTLAAAATLIHGNWPRYCLSGNNITPSETSSLLKQTMDYDVPKKSIY